MDSAPIVAQVDAKSPEPSPQHDVQQARPWQQQQLMRHGGGPDVSRRRHSALDLSLPVRHGAVPDEPSRRATASARDRVEGVASHARALVMPQYDAAYAQSRRSSAIDASSEPFTPRQPSTSPLAGQHLERDSSRSMSDGHSTDRSGGSGTSGLRYPDRGSTPPPPLPGAPYNRMGPRGSSPLAASPHAPRGPAPPRLYDDAVDGSGPTPRSATAIAAAVAELERRAEHVEDLPSLSVTAAVDDAVAYARSVPVSEFLDEVEDRITDMMDVGNEYSTTFASKRYAAEKLEHAERVLCRQIIASANNHVVFDPDINDTDDSMAVYLTIMWVPPPLAAHCCARHRH